MSGTNIEALGLLKMDFLGLRNLDVIDKACALIGDLDIGAIPLDDKKTYAMLARGESTGVFQFESSGMRDALRSVKPTVFEDLIALVALYRPGPMQYIPVYARRKHGARSPSRIPTRGSRRSRSSTYGICIYQEQYMEIAKKVAGFSPAEADDLRKAIGKKIHSLMASLKGKFLEGCASNGVTPGVANQLWADMEQAQDYSFNKSHAACYAPHRLPHGLAEGEPSEGVHGGAHLVRHEHEGQGAVLRQRVPRPRDRRAAARREHVDDRLRRRRGEDPLRPERGEERRRVRVPRDRARARGGRERSRRSGTSPSASTRRS